MAFPVSIVENGFPVSVDGVTENNLMPELKNSIKLFKYSNIFDLVPCTNRLIMPNQNYYTGNETQVTYRSNHTVTSPTSLIRLMYVNCSNSSVSAGNITLKVSIQAIPTSATNINTITNTILTFNGSQTITILPNGYAITDPIYLPLNPVDGAFYLVYTSVSSGASNGLNKWPRMVITAGTYIGNAIGEVLGNSGTSNAFSAGITGTYCPSLIGTYNFDNSDVWLGTGDSIMDGSNDQISTRGFAGFLSEIHKWKLSRISIAGDRVSTAKLFAIPRWQLSTQANKVLCNYGTNDIGAGDSLITVQQNLIDHWKNFYLLNQKVTQLTILPRTTSTDNWQTVTNQTIWVYDSIRTNLNNWLRAGAPCIVNGFTITPAEINQEGSEPCPYLWKTLDIATELEVNINNEKTINGGYWKVGQLLNTGTVTSATSTSISNTNINFQNIEVTGALIRIVSGLGVGQVNWIVGAASATQINLINSWTTIPNNTSVYEIVDTSTRDIIHPSTNAHKLISNFIHSELYSS